MSDADAHGLCVHVEQKDPIPLDATIECAAGELVTLVGPSGSGKTTILRSIAGLYRPHRGRITCNSETWFDGERRRFVPPQRRRVGLVFQDYALFPHLSALQNITLALGHVPRDRRLERARELIALVHLAGSEKRRPAQLSGGQRQRVALARAIARDPAILLLDEPFSAVDQVTRRKLQRELALLRQSVRIPIVFVTHDLGEASALGDHMYVLHRGRTLQNGPPIDVMNHPATPLVARLLGHSNIFEGVIRDHAANKNLCRVAWRSYTLEVKDCPMFPVGTEVSWVVAPSRVIMHRRDRPSRGERENPVRGVVSELATLGENTTITMLVDQDERCVLNFTVPTHAARRNAVAPGASLTVSLLAEGIHLMPISRKTESD